MAAIVHTGADDTGAACCRQLILATVNGTPSACMQYLMPRYSSCLHAVPGGKALCSNQVSHTSGLPPAAAAAACKSRAQDLQRAIARC